MKTPTSSQSQYPVLENRPIDQWKVTELKEELKRRRLKTGGLKDDLIKRLDESLRAEMEVEAEATNVEADNDNGAGGDEPENVVDDAVIEQPDFEAADSGAVTFGNADEVMGNVEDVMGNAVEFEDAAAKEDVGIADANVVQVEVDVKDTGEHLGKDEIVEEQQSGVVNDPLPSFGIMTGTDVGSVVVGNEGSDPLISEKAAGGDSLLDNKTERDNGDSGDQQHSEDIPPAHDDVKLDSSDQNNQVSEVSTSLGFPVKSNNSVSTDSLSIFEKNDLKDDLIADNVKLESDVKPEMVQPSSSDLVPDGGASHPRDVDKPHENKVSVEETDNTVANADMSQKNYSADFGSEKLNLDRSSGDDSMEEDASESKQIDSKYTSEDVGAATEKIEVAPKSESPVATTMDTDLPAEKKVINDQKNDTATLPDKRKLSDEEAVLNNKPAKRQHRWKTESKNATEPQTGDVPPPASAQDALHSAALRRSFSRSDSIGASDPPKEREVPTSTKPATNSLRIDRFLRPFTLKAVQELLGKTGTVASFWMDHIKTHCYVTYSSVEEAVETRNAVYNLQWPPNGGRQLLAEFVEPEEVKSRLEPPPPPAPPVNSAPTKVSEPPTIPQPSPRQQRQQMAPQPALPPPPPMTNQAPVREWAIPPPPPPLEKVDAPIVTLDDLFRKTKATPRIYYLPLSDEQVAARRENSKQ